MIKCIQFLPNYQFSKEEFGPEMMIYKLRNPYFHAKQIIQKLNLFCYFAKYMDLIHDLRQLIFELYNDINLNQIYEKELKRQLYSRNGDARLDLIRSVEFNIGGMRYW